MSINCKQTNPTVSPSRYAAIHGVKAGWIRQLLNVRRIKGARKHFRYWRVPVNATILPPKTPGTLPLKRPSRREIEERRKRKEAEQLALAQADSSLVKL